MARLATLSAVEAAYRWEGDAFGWREDLVYALASTFEGALGTIALSYRLDRGRPVLGDVHIAASVARRERLGALVHDAFAAAEAGMVRNVFSGPRWPLRTSSELVGERTFDAVMARVPSASELDIRDFVGGRIERSAGEGLLLGAFTNRVVALDRRHRAGLTRLFAHLEGGLRLCTEPLNGSARSLTEPPEDIGWGTPQLAAVASLVAAGVPQKIIAFELGIPQGSVYGHVAHLKAMFGESSTVRLVRRLRERERAREATADTGALDDLPPAERFVAEGVLRGLSTLQLAQLRGRSVRTVENLLGRAYRRLGVSSRKELAAKIRLRR